MPSAEPSDAAARGLTPRRRKIVEIIDDSVRRHGYAPSMREIGEAVGLASTSSVSYQLSVLEVLAGSVPDSKCATFIRPITAAFVQSRRRKGQT